MKSIKTFKQFNENTTHLHFHDKDLYQYNVEDLHLNKEEDVKIKHETTDIINKMNSLDKLKVSEELEKLTKKFGCTLEDLTNPVLVKEYLDREIIMRNKDKELEAVQEGLGDYIKEKLLKFFSYIFGLGAPILSVFMIVSGAINNSFWGVFTGAMALTISILASAWISSKTK